MQLTLLAALSAAALLQNVICLEELPAEGGYFGKSLGPLSEHHHAVKGQVYAVDSRTLHIRHFSYDGEGPGAYFFVGTSKAPNGDGTKLRDEKGRRKVLRKYNDEHITLTLPEGKTLSSIKWFSVWCEDFSVNFGDVRIPKNFDAPKPQKLEFLSGIHGVSSDPVVIVDSQTFLVPNFSYDGEAPDAKFWVGSGEKPTSQGTKVADENGRFEPLKKYDRKTLVITLPGNLTVQEIGHFGIWCEAFAVDFAHVKVPSTASVPPSLRMLGVSPQSKLNCEILHEASEFEVRWALAGDSAVIQLVAKVDPGEYMSFGLSGDIDKTVMIGGDAVVAWVDPDDFQGHAMDYFLEGKSQCAGTRGSCPDNRIREGTENIRLLNSALVNGYSIITYQRPLKAADELDKSIFNNGTKQAIMWAIGPLNSKKEVSFHSDYPKNTIKFDFNRSPEWNCPLPNITSNTPSSAASSLEKEMASTVSTATPKPVQPPKDAWDIPPIPCHEPEDGVFYAQMGPTGGKRGYSAITGHVGWGISWFINGLLIPEINVVRGKAYTFVVEGGDNPEIPARYHPFYITDDPIGGFEHKTAEERKAVKVFAGVKSDKRGKFNPTATGRLCNWTPNPEYAADDSPSFGAYQQTLKLECDDGEPGILRWTPDNNTPDTVYYQCYTHRYLGWKINVVDSCDKTQADASSESSEDLIDRTGEDDDEPEEAASIIFETRVKVPAGEKILLEEDDITDAQPSPSAPADLVPPSAAQASYVNDLTSRSGEASPDAESKEHPQFESPKVTETFEPMFVPSPIDRNIKETPRVNAFRPPPTKGKHFLRRPPPRHRISHPVQKRAPFYRRTHHHQY